jgi:DNA-binding response OmpR family regulator
VDDNPVSLKITAALVRKAAPIVDMAESAEDAIAQLDANRPDLVVTDLHLPGMDGLGLARAVRKNPAWNSIVVVLLTADNSVGLEPSARDAGCAGLISKPVDVRVFPGLISAFLGVRSPAASTSPLDDLPLQELCREFLASGAADCRELLSRFTSSRTFVPETDIASICSALHRWAGVGGTLGFPSITRLARRAEDVTTEQDPQRRDQLCERLTALLYEFTHAVPKQQTVPAPDRESPAQGGVPGGARPMVLVVDDDPTIRALLKLSLEANGYSCRLADDGVVACALARNDPPDVIVLDVEMPGMNGFEVLYTLRHQWSTKTIPVMLLTARRSEGDIVRAAQLGALSYMSKPFEVHDLLVRLHDVLLPKAAQSSRGREPGSEIQIPGTR